MRAALESLGENIIECASGEEALRTLLQYEFAVIILDVRLPGMNGFDIAASIRERPSSRDTPIIFLTGLSRDEPQVSRGYSLGAVDYLIKPVNPNILRAKVRVFVDLYKKTEEVRRQTEQIFILRERERDRARESERLAREHEILVKEKKTAVALARKAAELQRSNSELQQFAYIASHDLQEPLRTITSFCELLKEECEGKLTPAADEYMRFITEAASRLSFLIKGLLDHTRIGRAPEKEPVDCAAVVQEVLKDLGASIAEAHANIVVCDLPSVIGNYSDLRLLFQNLISNAIKFRKNGQAPEIRISAEKEGQMWKFAVQDSGIGVEKEHRKRIFDIFQRGHPQSVYEGAGIGLAHCRKIVELYGGSIWVESDPGKGSTFFFSLPSHT